MRGTASSKKNKKCTSKPTKCNSNTTKSKDDKDVNEVASEALSLSNVLTKIINKDDSTCLPSCDKNVLKKLESVFNGFTGEPIASHLDGDQIRKKIQEEKSVSKNSFEDIKLFFTDALTLDVSHCALASKYLRIFIDLLDSAQDSQLELTIQSCDLVITVHNYYILKGELTNTEKFVAMLHHVVKQMYKKQCVKNILLIMKNMVDFVQVSLCHNITFAEESKRSLSIIHQMCYSLYYQQLQKLMKVDHKSTDVASFFDLRIRSLIVLSYSGWKENKFLEHLVNFIGKEAIVLMQSPLALDKETLTNSLVDLLTTLYKLIECVESDERKMLLNATWKFLVFCMSFCLRFQLANELCEQFMLTPDSLCSSFTKSLLVLRKSFDFCKVLSLCHCICSSDDLDETSQYPVHITNYFNTHGNKVSDVSRLFDVLNLLKVNMKEVSSLCGSVINTLIEVSSFAAKTLSKAKPCEQKNRTLPLLSYVCSLFLHIKTQLFSESKENLQCYKKNPELLSSFSTLYNDFIAVLKSLPYEQTGGMNQEELKWMAAVLYKVGVHYYNMKQYNVALPSLDFCVFLCEFCRKNDADVTHLKDLTRKYNTLGECHLKQQNHTECILTYLRSIKCYESLSSEQLYENKSLLEAQVRSCVKKKMEIASGNTKQSKCLEKCIIDEFSNTSENDVFLSLVLEFEYYIYKDLNGTDTRAITNRLFTLRKDECEKAGEMLKYALCMIEMSTCLSFQHEERLHWCSEAIGLVEEFHENLDDDGEDDEFEFHVCDILAVGYFQVSILKYEAKVKKSMDNIGRDVNELVEESGNDVASSNGKNFYGNCVLEEDYIDKQFITYLNEAMKMWTKLVERALKSDAQSESSSDTGNLNVFHDAECAAKCLYQAAVFYSLLSQNVNSAKASYLSGLIYQMLSTKDIKYQEKQVASWALTASQFLLVKNVSSGEEILQKLGDTKNYSVFSKLHIEVLKAAYMLYSGQVQSSAESFKQILETEVLNDNTKSSLIIKSDIYFLLSYLKLIPLKEEGEVIISHNEHFPSKSPFPPISDCLKYLRSLYSKYVEGAGAQCVDVTVSGNWAYLDKLLVCLTRNAELLKHQGSILEAKSLLKEALLLTQKYHLSLRSVEILQQLSSMDLILKNNDAFNKTFEIISKILQPSVENCFCEGELMLPAFVNHHSQCSCYYCIYPKLQEIHIVLYLQYIESKQHFCQISSEEYNSAIELIDVLVENAYNRYIVSLTEVYRIVNMSFQSFSGLQLDEGHSQLLKGKKIGTSKSKSKLVVSKDNSGSNKEYFNIFLQYSFEAKINRSLSENQRMAKTLEELISKLQQTSDGFDQPHHEYHRLCAQLYHLRTLLCLNGEAVENVWFSQKNDESATHSSMIACKKNLYIDTQELDNKLSNCNLDDRTPVKPLRRVKQKNMRKGRLYAAESNDNAVKKNSTKKSTKKKTNISNESNILNCLEDLRKSLSVLNPYTDTLIIKAIYQLLILLSGTSNKGLTIACHLLSSSRILHQQMLNSCSKKLRDRKLLPSSSLSETKGKEVLETTSNILEKFSDPKLVFDQEHVQYLMGDHVLQDWCICSLSLTELESKRYLIICRLQRSKEPIVVKINISDKPQCNRGKNVVCDLAAAFDPVDLLEKFNRVMEESEESMKLTETKVWWSERVRLDKELKSIISRLEDDWLQGWKGMLLGQCGDNELESNRNKIADEIADTISSAIGKVVEKDLIKCLLDGFEYCTKYQVVESLQTLYGEQDAKTVYEIFVRCLEKSKYNDVTDGVFDDGGPPMRKPVILVLDKTLQKLPWESMNILRDQPMTRMPSLLLASSHCKNYIDKIINGIAIEKCCYILNPKDDLKRTEEKFSDWFKHEGWQGIVGRPPTSVEYSNAICENDLFIYCGHGSGQEYLGWSSVNRLQSSAVALLMGCSSGKLLVQGELEAHGMVLYYLSAGCPAVVANLWNVTDRDIDLFLEKLLVSWLNEDRGSSLAECVAKARHTCKLEYLNGAAPVVYGLPLFVKDR